jgi:hypothetical protein
MTARRLARHWVVAPVGTIGVADSTLSSLSEELTYLEKQSLTVLPPQTILGVSAEGVRASFGTFWITVSDPTRPLELVLSGGHGVAKYLGWNNRTPPTPPADATPVLPR